MAFRFFQMPAWGCDQAESELNGYLETHRVPTVTRQVGYNLVGGTRTRPEVPYNEALLVP